MKRSASAPGLRQVKSVHSAGVRSIPKVQRSGYLELYMMDREKDRLEQEIVVLDKRRNTAKKQIDDIHNRMKELEKQAQTQQGVKSYRSVPTKPLKSMAMRY